MRGRGTHAHTRAHALLDDKRQSVVTAPCPKPKRVRGRHTIQFAFVYCKHVNSNDHTKKTTKENGTRFDTGYHASTTTTITTAISRTSSNHMFSHTSYTSELVAFAVCGIVCVTPVQTQQ